MRNAYPALTVAIFGCLSIWPAAWGFAHAEVGSVIDDVEMTALDGGKRRLLADNSVNVFVFFKPGQEHSRAVMKGISRLEKETSGKPVHWAGIVSDTIPKDNVIALVKETGIAMPVLVDAGDALYGRLGVALQPVVGIADKDHKLLAYQPFTKINYIEVIRAQVRHALKEIDDKGLAQALHPPVATPGDNAATARRRLSLAEKLLQAKNYGKALENVRIGIEKEPRLAAGHALHGEILAAQGHCAEALQAFERALALEPSDPRALGGKKACEGK
ncbi:MAG: tetratricopeptide repeat protein [Thermodesulfobacteriota bacterium]